MSPWSESSHASLPIFAFMLFSLKEIKAMNHLNEGRSTKYKMSLHQDSLLELFSFIYLVFHNFQVIKLQHVEKFKGGEYFCKALYLITILLPVPAFQQSFALRSMRT